MNNQNIRLARIIDSSETTCSVRLLDDDGLPTRHVLTDIPLITNPDEKLLALVSPDMKIKADSGYQGIAAYHANSEVPFKKSKTHPLSAEEKVFNRELYRRRIVIENINAEIKVFKIMAYPYRNRRCRHLLRTKLVCAILNAEKT